MSVKMACSKLEKGDISSFIVPSEGAGVWWQAGRAALHGPG